jgi:hypothetical protein
MAQGTSKASACFRVLRRATDCWIAGISMLCPAGSRSSRARRSQSTSLWLRRYARAILRRSRIKPLTCEAPGLRPIRPSSDWAGAIRLNPAGRLPDVGRSLRRRGRPSHASAHVVSPGASFLVSAQMQVAVVGASVIEPVNQPGIARIGHSGNADLISVCNGSAGCARPTCIILLTNGAVTARLIARHQDWMLGWSCTDKRICGGDAGSQASTSPPYFQ